MAILTAEVLLRENKKNPVTKCYPPPVGIEPGPLITSDRDWDLISICIYTEFCIDQLRIPLGVQSTDATANGGLAPKPPEPGWYPQCLPLWLDSVSIRKDTQLYECFSLCYDDPAPGQG